MYLWSKEGANALTQRVAQSMQQVMKSTYFAATQKEVSQGRSLLCRGKRRISGNRRARTKLSLPSFFLCQLQELRLQ